MRTIYDFEVDYDVWPVVDEWASEHGYSLVQSSGSRRVYQRGNIMWSMPTMLQISVTDGAMHLEAWLRRDEVSRTMVMITSLFIVRPPLEVALESGGLMGVTARSKAREQVNVLLQRLGQPLIP